MAEGSRKRARKSTLVPRECIEDFEVRPSSSQLRAKKAVRDILPRIKGQMEKDESTSNHPREFSVNIEVESFEDEVYNYDHYGNIEEDINLTEAKGPLHIKEEDIRKEAEKLMQVTTSKVDKQLEVEIRNYWGKNTIKIELTREDRLVQAALESWRVWVHQSKKREDMLVYICYVCHTGWWTLHPFREHLKQHMDDDLVVKVVTYTYECRFIAYKSNTPIDYDKQISIEGNCWKCEKSLEAHNKPVNVNTYQCKFCQMSPIMSCTVLKDHESKCHKYVKSMFSSSTCFAGDIKCEVCNLNCLTKERYHSHMTTRHLVRSDVPVIWAERKQCSRCSQKYFNHTTHDCPERIKLYRCKFCFKGFNTKVLAMMHEKYSKNDHFCIECEKHFQKECMEPAHLWRHSDNYVAMHKCSFCTDVYLATERELKTHCNSQHSCYRNKICYNLVIVPRTIVLAACRNALKSDGCHNTKLKDSVQDESCDLVSQEQCEEKDGVTITQESDGDDYLTYESSDTRNENINDDVKVKQEVLSDEKLLHFDGNTDETDSEQATSLANQEKLLRLSKESDSNDTYITNITVKTERVSVDEDMEDDFDFDSLDMEIQKEHEELELLYRNSKNMKGLNEYSYLQEELIIKNEPMDVEEGPTEKKRMLAATVKVETSKPLKGMDGIHSSEGEKTVEEQICDEEDDIIILDNTQIRVEQNLQSPDSEPHDEDTNNATNNNKEEEKNTSKNLLECAKEDKVTINDENCKQVSNHTENNSSVQCAIEHESISAECKVSENTSNNLLECANDDAEQNEVEILKQDNQSHTETNTFSQSEIKHKNEKCHPEIDITQCTKKNKYRTKNIEKDSNSQTKTNELSKKTVSDCFSNEKNHTKNQENHQNIKINNLEVKFKQEPLDFDSETDAVEADAFFDNVTVNSVIKTEKCDNSYELSAKTSVTNENIDEKHDISGSYSKKDCSSNKIDVSDMQQDGAKKITIKTEPMDEDTKMIDFEDFIDNIIKDGKKEKNEDNYEIEITNEDKKVIDKSKNNEARKSIELKNENESFESDNYDDTENDEPKNNEASQESNSNVDCNSLMEANDKNEDSKLCKIYSCVCGFESRHREWKLHIKICRQRRKNKTRKIKGQQDKIKDELDDGVYPCSKCSTVFPQLCEYLSHLTRHGYKRGACPQCGDVMANVPLLYTHVVRHVKQAYGKIKLIQNTDVCISSRSSGVFRCRDCAANVTRLHFFEHWEGHLDYNHAAVNSKANSTVQKSSGATETASCSGSTSQSRTDSITNDAMIKKIINELIRPPPPPRKVKQCVACGRRFKRINDLKRHLIEHLVSEALSCKARLGALVCQICGFTGGDKLYHYKEHMRTHACLPLYRCEMCDRAFSDSSNFTKHLKIHNPLWICKLCRNKFQSKASLDKHLQEHATTEPMVCCDKKFYVKSHFRKHVRSRHEVGVRKFVCNICSMRFDTLRLKWDHLWAEHKERRHKADCPLCPQSFRKYADVKRHIRYAHNIHKAPTKDQMNEIMYVFTEQD